MTPQQALLVGLLLLVAAAGKSALVPFSGWLPRAMEGPTPSSAVFYGALSVHLGAFLLLRVSPLLERSPLLCAAIVALGLTTAVFAYLAGSVQTDIKSALSFASLSQVGIIVAEIGLGLPLHRAGPHPRPRLPADAPVRAGTDAAPGLPHAGERHRRAPARGPAPPGAGWRRAATTPGSTASRWSAATSTRCSWTTSSSPFVRAFRWCDALERRWTDFLAGEASRESDQVKPHFGTIEEFS